MDKESVESRMGENLDTENNSKVIVSICGFNMSSLPKNTRFLVAVVGIFTAYICYGALQEAIFTANNMRLHSPLLTLYQFLLYSIFGYAELRLQGIPLKRTGLHLYSLLAVLTLCTIGFSNASVSYLNYPTQVMFKCCKMIPVMIGGVFLQNKRYNAIEVCAVLLMTLGLISFTMVDVAVQPSFSIIGVVLVSMALCCDGCLGNCQEKMMHPYKCANIEIVFYSYFIGFNILLCCLTVTGGLFPSVAYFNAHPVQTYGYGTAFSICGYFGVHFVLCLVESHGALTAVTVTTFRKALSMVISFVFFEKAFSSGYIFSALLVVFGIYLNVYNKHRSKWNEAILSKARQWGLGKPKTSTILPL